MDTCIKKDASLILNVHKALLTCDNLVIEPGGLPLFSGLGFSLLEGAGLVLQGANGSGKTTLLKILAGVMQPQSGAVTLRDGLDGTDILFIGHQHAIKLDATVYENLLFWSEMRGEPMLLGAAISHFDLHHLLDTPCRALSAGWRRRVALAKLICCPAQLWLLDEPTANLDADGEKMVLGLIKARISGGGGVIAAMHSMNDNYREVLPHAVAVEDFNE